MSFVSGDGIEYAVILYGIIMTSNGYDMLWKKNHVRIVPTSRWISDPEPTFWHGYNGDISPGHLLFNPALPGVFVLVLVIIVIVSLDAPR